MSWSEIYPTPSFYFHQNLSMRHYFQSHIYRHSSKNNRRSGVALSTRHRQ